MNKKLAVLMSLAAICLTAGCATPPPPVIPPPPPPQFLNVTGVWNYTYGQNEAIQGKFTLTQDGFNITGEANSVDGQFEIQGTISGTHLNLEGIDSNTQTKFDAVCKVQDENNFAGTYTTKTTTSQIIAVRAKSGN